MSSRYTGCPGPGGYQRPGRVHGSSLIDDSDAGQRLRGVLAVDEPLGRLMQERADADGRYRLTITTSKPVIIEALGGSYEDEATGRPINLPTDTAALSTVLSSPADTPKAAVTALTAMAMQGQREKILAAGMDDYLAKPFEPEDLLQLVRRWIKPANE